MKQISIVIVNYNGKDLLKTLLKSISESTYKNYEIIVVDNNSNDNSQDFIKKNYKNVKLIANKRNLGYSGINSGLRYCTGDYILFLNNDIEIDKNCISSMLKVIKSDKNTAMTAPKLVNYYNKNLKSNGTWVSRAFYCGHIKGNHEKTVKEIPYLGVGLIKKEVVDQYDYLFDPDYFIYAEDFDLGLRIRLLGMKVLFVPNAIMYHMHSATMQKSSSARNTFLLERNLLITFFKNIELRNIILFMPYVLFGRFTAIIKDILSFQLRTAISRIKAIFWILFNLKLIIKKRNETQKLRKVNDNYLFEIFSEKYLFKKKFIV